MHRLKKRGERGVKQKKKDNNKFDFDNEVFIGISSNNNKNNLKPKSKNTTKKSTKNSSKKKQKKPKKKKSLKIVKIAILLIILFAVVAFLCMAPMFNIKEIIVEKNDKVSSDELKKLSGIGESNNLFTVSKKEIREKLGKNPYIDEIKINRVFPNKIKFVVKERTPDFLVQYNEGEYIYIDDNGYILERSNEKLELPILLGFSTKFDDMIQNPNNKNRLNEDDLKKLDTVLKIMNVAENYEVNNLITKIDVSNSKDYKLILETENKVAYLGKADDLNTRILWMKEIINSEQGNKGEIFVNGNLNEDAPFFRQSV